MTHDQLCPYREGPKWDDFCPMCRLIARVREDERQRAGIRQARPSWKYPVPLAPTVRQS